MHQLVEEHFKRRFRALKLVAVVLHLLELVHHHLGVGRGLVDLEAPLHRLVDHVALAGKLRNQDAPFVADHRGVHVLVGGSLFHHRAHMNSAFVGKRTLADVGQILASAAGWPAR